MQKMIRKALLDDGWCEFTNDYVKNIVTSERTLIRLLPEEISTIEVEDATICPRNFRILIEVEEDMKKLLWKLNNPIEYYHDWLSNVSWQFRRLMEEAGDILKDYGFHLSLSLFMVMDYEVDNIVAVFENLISFRELTVRYDIVKESLYIVTPKGEIVGMWEDNFIKALTSPMRKSDLKVMVGQVDSHLSIIKRRVSF